MIIVVNGTRSLSFWSRRINDRLAVAFSPPSASHRARPSTIWLVGVKAAVEVAIDSLIIVSFKYDTPSNPRTMRGIWTRVAAETHRLGRVASFFGEADGWVASLH